MMTKERKRDFTTVAVKPHTHDTLDRFMEKHDTKSMDEAIKFLIWYHDLTYHFEYGAQSAEEQAETLVTDKNADPVLQF